MGWKGFTLLGSYHHPLRSRGVILGIFDAMKILLILSMAISAVNGRRAWEAPGCHRLGHTRDVYIPGCVKFRVRTNACRGFCTSYSIPSPYTTLNNNPNHIITSRAECCSMDKTHDVRVHVRCLDGYREYIFKSAASCSCSVCHHS